MRDAEALAARGLQECPGESLARRVRDRVHEDIELTHSRLSSSKAASIWASMVTSSGMVRRDPSECASGSTRSFILSLT